MNMTYNGTIAMPANYAVVTAEEMTYVDGGWSIKFNPTKKWGIYTGADVTLTATVSDCAWIAAAGGAFTATVAGLALAVPGAGPVLALKATVIGGAFVSFAATVVATNDRASKKTFTCTKHIGL